MCAQNASMFHLVGIPSEVRLPQDVFGQQPWLVEETLGDEVPECLQDLFVRDSLRDEVPGSFHVAARHHVVGMLQEMGSQGVPMVDPIGQGL